MRRFLLCGAVGISIASWTGMPAARAWDWPWDSKPKPTVVPKECPDGYIEQRNGACLDIDEAVSREMQRKYHDECVLHKAPDPHDPARFANIC